MTEDKYNHFWENAFFDFASKIETSLSGSVIFDKNTKDSIWKLYEEYRNRYKKVNGFKNDEKIDRHKIASILICAITANSTLSPTHTNVSEEGYLANVAFAIQCSTHVLVSYIVKEFNENQTIKSLNDINEFEIVCPPTIKDNDSYFKILARVLCKLQISVLDNQNKHFVNHLLTLLPHIFFFLESFSVKNFKERLHNNIQ